MGKYQLQCLSCHSQMDDNYHLSCKCRNGFLRTNYFSQRFSPTSRNDIWRFSDWLPIRKTPEKDNCNGSKTVVFKSKGLAKELELKNLYIAFNGYWPEKDAKILTGTFKGLESPPTLRRAVETGIDKLLLATAGNTGRAFAEEAIRQDFKVVIVAPESAKSRLWTTTEPNGNIRLITLKNGNDYTNAIETARALSAKFSITPEGGAKNVARRDGMATCFLEGVATIRKMPQHYFQAVGSGTGAIATWEASKRVLKDGRFGNYLPRLHLSQNERFQPMVKAWNDGRRNIIPEDISLAPEEVSSLYAEVLANRTPPYSVIGGLYDALSETNGIMYGISDEKAQEASSLFLETEEIDIVPPAAVMVASLIEAVNKGTVNKKDTILINVTGGGIQRLEEDYELISLKPVVEIGKLDDSLNELTEILD